MLLKACKPSSRLHTPEQPLAPHHGEVITRTAASSLLWTELRIVEYLEASMVSRAKMLVASQNGDNRKYLQTWPDVPWGTKAVLLENHSDPGSHGLCRNHAVHLSMLRKGRSPLLPQGTAVRRPSQGFALSLCSRQAPDATGKGG